ACSNYVTAATTGVLKVMSKMGIAAVSSYRGAQFADVTGLHQDLLDNYFGGINPPISGADLEDLAADVEARHRSAFLPRPEENAHRDLELGGEYKWRREGEFHLFNPETIFKLQHQRARVSTKFSKTTPARSMTNLSVSRLSVAYLN